MKYKHYFAAMTVALLLLTGCQQIPTATPGKDTSIQALTETQPPAPEITPLTNIVRCDPITLPDDISRYITHEFKDFGLEKYIPCVVISLSHPLFTAIYKNK